MIMFIFEFCNFGSYPRCFIKSFNPLATKILFLFHQQLFVVKKNYFSPKRKKKNGGGEEKKNLGQKIIFGEKIQNKKFKKQKNAQ